ncbi:MAG: 3-hydroxyacyl-ACP dehydratase FabZ [Nevskiaceae bacterium]|jgi:3-hydroxyacyl-[acyl-carrier-protein] dehydratase|nr:3-hydroxyacyl-ACP dehydratase FabZ [Nevskiaceae bacterium]
MTTENKPFLDIFQLLNYLPHRYPFLLVDRVLDFKSGESITAIKNVTFNEPHFTGHFPERPVMPGVLILEALAQTAGVLVFATIRKVPNKNTRFYFAGIDNCRFRRPVEPGDVLTMTATVERNMKGIWKLGAVAKVGEVEAASATLMLFPDADNASPLPPDAG